MGLIPEDQDRPETTFGKEETRLSVRPTTSLRLEAVSPEPPEEGRSLLGFLRALFTPRCERALLAGCREIMEGNLESAERHLRKVAHLPDGAFALGFLALEDHRLEEAEKHLRTALAQADLLGSDLARHGQSLVIQFPTGPRSSIRLEPSLRGTLIGLIEICRKQERSSEVSLLRMRLRQEAMPDEHGEITGLGS